ncbi:MAG: 2-succinyl-5-enolpyruvyl-6-hydroxy-3-cyclohexene-1-carboxylic-acid synthase, partial [Thermoanaerobaculia bacterium]
MRDVPFRRPLVIAGALREADRDRVRRFLVALNAPVYAEAMSGLREDTAIRELSITAGERMIARGKFDGVVRIGGVPTLRFWRDLDESRRDLPVVSFSRLPFAGLSRGEVKPIEEVDDIGVTARERDDALFRSDREFAAAIEAILREERDSELAMFRRISGDIPAGARVYVGNSLPIREWDLVAIREPRGITIEANRGANGIDGQLSTFFGQCDPERPNAAVVGDLTALYDMNAPWIVPQLDPATRFTIYIINNGGGRIFGRVASLQRVPRAVRERLIENVHDLHFEHWTMMWNLGHQGGAPAPAPAHRE